MAKQLKLSARVTVTTPGTPQRVSATSLFTASALIQAEASNAGALYVGDSMVSSTNGIEVQPGESLSVDGELLAGSANEINLNDVWIDAETGGDRARVAYITVKR